MYCNKQMRFQVILLLKIKISLLFLEGIKNHYITENLFSIEGISYSINIFGHFNCETEKKKTTKGLMRKHHAAFMSFVLY